MDDQATTQLRLIAEIERVLRSAKMRFWLRGGWALDFIIGRITRQHSDIDLVTWRRHASRIERLLVEAGYRVATVTDLAAIHFEKSGQDIGIAFIANDKDGKIVTPGREFWPWPEGAFPATELRLEGITCRTMSAAALLEEKENYEKHSGRALRPKDVETIAVLRSLV